LEPAAAPSAESRPALSAVLVATFFVRLAFGVTVVVFAAYLTGASVGISSNELGVAGIVSAMAPFGEFSTVLFSGYLADRYGRWPILFGGIGAAALLFVGAAFTRSPLALGGINFLFGVGSGAILAASLAVIGDRAAADHRGYEMGRFDAVNLFGWTTGIGVGLALLGVLPNRSLGDVFGIGAGALGVGLAVAALLLRGRARDAPRRGVPIGAVLTQAFRRPVLLVTLPWLVIYVLIGTALVFLGPAATGTGIPTGWLALGIAAGGLGLVATQPYYGTLADRYGRSRLMTAGTVGVVAAMGGASLLVAVGPRLPILAAIGISAVVALAYGPAALAALADLSRQISRATTMAIYSLTISLGMVVGLFGSTALYAGLGDLGLYVFFGSIAAAFVLLNVVRIRDEARAAVTTPAR
jgi:AAHS family benzoate transporter-like MFS transporter